MGDVASASRERFEVKLRRPVVAWNDTRVAISRRIGGRWRLIGWGLVKA